MHTYHVLNISQQCNRLTYWGRVMYICVNKLAIIGSDNGLSPGRCRAIIWTNDGILLIWPLRTNFSEILGEIYTFSFRKMRFKMSSAKWPPFCLGLNVLNFDQHNHIAFQKDCKHKPLQQKCVLLMKINDSSLRIKIKKYQITAPHIIVFALLWSVVCKIWNMKYKKYSGIWLNHSVLFKFAMIP